MKRIRAVLVACLVLPAAAAAAQDGAASGHSVFHDYLNPSSRVGGLLRIPGLDFHSSIGFSYSSSAYGAAGMGYYLGHFSYRFGRSLTLNFDVGVGSQLVGPEGIEGHHLFLPNIDLMYRPSDHMLLRLQFQRGRYGSPWLGDAYPRRF